VGIFLLQEFNTALESLRKEDFITHPTLPSTSLPCLL
jgi:hypothetical protein